MLKEEEMISASTELPSRREFLKLSIEERRRILAGQAKDLMAHYSDQTATRDREAWQGGDVVEL
jgi:hypothetical protein